MNMMDETQYINQSNTTDKVFSDYVAAFIRRKWQFTAIFSVLILIAIAVTFLLPAIYKSSAIILIEQQEIPQDLVRTTVTSYADQRIQMISQRVMTTTNMKTIIDKYNLYEDDRKEEPMEVILSNMREDISLDMISADIFDPRTGRAAKATIAFSLSYLNQSPQLAQKVANEFVSLFLNENLKSRTEMAEEANEFLQDEADRLVELVKTLEINVAEFKETNAGSLPEMVSINIDFMDRQDREVSEVKRQIQSLEERKIYLESELLQLKPNLGNFSETGERIMGPRDRLKMLETRLISLTARYSEAHPDVTKVKKEIRALEKNVGINQSKKEIAVRLKQARTQLISLADNYSAVHPDVKKQQRLVSSLEAEMTKEPEISVDDIPGEEPDNPAYIQIQTDLEATKSELSSLKIKQNALREKLQLYEERLIKSPQVEREYRSLLREYENTLVKFKEIKAKQMEAQLAENLESEKKGERFALIEPPLMPEKPDKPNRFSLFFIGLIASVGTSFGSIFLLDNFDRGVYGRKGVERLLGRSPLTVIPYIETEAERRRRHLKYGLMFAIAVLLCITTLVLIHFYYKPLDVLWFVLLRKFGFA